MTAPGTLTRTVGYGLAALAGAWSAVFPSNTLAEPLHYWSAFVWALILFLAAGTACVASITGRFRVEYVAIVPVLGCLTAYDAALAFWTFGGSTPEHNAQLTSGGAAFIIFALCVLVVGRLVDLNSLVKR